MRQHSVMLKRGSVQALFQGYYHDDNLAAINNDNAKGVINIRDMEGSSPAHSNRDSKGYKSSNN